MTEDCDHTDANIFPGADEICDEIDHDCDGDVDEDAADAQPFYVDGDTYGDPPLERAHKSNRPLLSALLCAASTASDTWWCLLNRRAPDFDPPPMLPFPRSDL